MSKKQETGHAKNVALFEELISVCTTFGATYNPGQAAFALPTLQTLSQSLKNVMQRIRGLQVDNNNAVNARAILFRQLKTLAGQLVNALDAFGATPETMADARLLLNKIRGIRVSAKPEEIPGADPSAKKVKTISAAQTSYDSLLEHFARLVEITQREPTYAAREEKTSIAGLTAALALYTQANKTVVDTRSLLDAARIDRDDLLYKADTGMVALANDVKKYVKSVFGLSSPQYKQLSKLQFRVPKRK